MRIEIQDEKTHHQGHQASTKSTNAVMQNVTPSRKSLVSLAVSLRGRVKITLTASDILLRPLMPVHHQPVTVIVTQRLGGLGGRSLLFVKSEFA